MTIAICPGSFDPVTNGHIDIFERASKMFDEVIVGVFNNINKKPLFTVEERVALLKQATSHIPNVKVDCFAGLLADYAHQKNAHVIVRGLRDANDFLYEFPRAMLIKNMAPDIENIFLTTDNKYYHVSSSAIRELAQFGGDITHLVPHCVELAIHEKIKRVPTSK